MRFPGSPLTLSGPDANGTVTGSEAGAFTDGDGDTFTYSGPSTSANGGAVTVNADGTFSYTPTRRAAASGGGEPGQTDFSS